MSESNKTQDAPADAEATDASGTGRKRPLLLVAALVAVIAAGYTFLAPNSADAAAEKEAEPTPGKVVVLEPITLNLADGRFIKVGLALQLVEGTNPPAEGAIPGYSAPAVDTAISFLGSKSYAELVEPGGRDAAKAELSRRIAEHYPEEVLSIYFTELVMQ